MRLPLRYGSFTHVDAIDYHRLTTFDWFSRIDGYVYGIPKTGERRIVSLSRIIMSAPPNTVVDHKDGNPLNNRRSNLRFCTQRQNTYNRRLNTNSTSGYKGVHWHKRNRVWVAYLDHNKTRRHLGCFHSADLAARAYNIAARQCHGQFARLNDLSKGHIS
jgi:hypothetical protein